MSFLFVDRILELTLGESIKGVKHITSADYYLTEKQEFIPSLIGETLGQLAAWNVMLTNGFTKRPVAGIASSAKLLKPAPVGKTLLLESWIDRLDDEQVEYHGEARIDDEIVFSLDGALGPMLPMEDFISAETARRQFESIHQPQDGLPMPNALKKDTLSLPLAFDSILKIQKQESIIAKKYIPENAPWFEDHFPRKPVLPMTLFLECNIHLANEFVQLSGFPVTYRVHELRRVKMNDFILPKDEVITMVKVKSCTPDELVLTFRSEVEGKRVCLMEMVLRA